MKRPGGVLTVLLLSAGMVSSTAAQSGRALAHYDLEGAAAWQEKLPADLSEVSGLAFTGDGRLLAHGDERGVVWRYDLKNRRPTDRFGLGDRWGVLEGDFEGTESKRVHAAAGAGLWLSFFEPHNRLSLAWASSREGDRWYLRWGLGY